MDAAFVCPSVRAITPRFRAVIQLQNTLCRYMVPFMVYLKCESTSGIMSLDVTDIQNWHWLWLLIVFGLTGTVFCGSCILILWDIVLVGNPLPLGVTWSVWSETIRTLVALMLASLEVGMYFVFLCYSDTFVILKKVQLLETRCKSKH